MVKDGLKIVVPALAVLMTSVAFAQSPSTINVHVQVSASKAESAKIRAIGFSVNGSKTGSLGSSTTKQASAGKYTFGLRKKDGSSVKCGSANLSKDSFVKIFYNGKSCRIEHIYSYPKK